MVNPTEQPRPDAELIAAAVAGDAAAFGGLVRRHWPMVVAIALTRMGDRAEAEDIAQETFLKAYAQLGALRDASRFAGWIGRIAHQRCTDALRKTLRRRRILGVNRTAPESLETVSAPAGNPGLTSGQIRFVREAVVRLPGTLRDCIIMRFVSGLSAAQIARQLGKRPGTIRARLHRAYTLLREGLTPIFEEVEP